MAFCLPKALTQKFLTALKNGTLDPAKLSELSSADRHAAFEEVVGKGNAAEVNALFESKLLLKNQQRGMIDWAKSIGGLKPEILNNIVTKIQNMDKFLNAADAKSFLSDLAAKRLGTEVTFEEAKQITDLSKEAQATRDALAKDPLNYDAQVAYGRALIDMKNYVESLKPQNHGVGYWTNQILSLPKSALTSVLHFSAPFVQGRGLLMTRPWWEAFGNQFKYYVSAESYKNFNASIMGHPDYQLAVKGGLGLTRLGDKLSAREEALQSSLLEHVPVLRPVVLASSRAFTGFLNEVRFKNFVNLVQSARLRGEDVSMNSKTIKDIANVVNNFSGRGGLGGISPEWQPALNNVFFSPRKIVATVQMFNPQTYLDPRISTTAKLGAVKFMAGQVISTAAILELAHLAGASVNLNPTNTDFLKIRIGNITIDTTGGSAIYLRLIGREIMGQSQSAAGKTSSLTSGKFGTQSRGSDVGSFLLGKLAPVAGTFADFLFNQNPAAFGKPFNLAGSLTGGKGSLATSEAYNRLTPIVMQQFINLAMSDPKNAAIWLPALSGIFGVEVYTPVK
jgi:hypothetical protein